MAGYGTPDWVNPTQNSNDTAVSEANVAPGVTASAASGQNGQGAVRGKGGCLLSLLSLLNMGLGVMMAALGVLTVLSFSKTTVDEDGETISNNIDLSEPFLAIYMILFAVLLFMYELMWWSPFPILNANMRKNFGFMYGLRGKGVYLIFVAFLCFGLGKDASVLILNYLTGISFLVAGLLHIFVVCSKPEIAAEYQPPGRSSKSDAGENVV